MDQKVIVLGNPIDGIRLIGPFDTSDDANVVAEQHFPNDTWWIADLEREP